MRFTRVAPVVMISLALAGHARGDARTDVEAAVRAHLKTFGADPIVGLAPTALVYLNNDVAKADEPFNFGVLLTATSRAARRSRSRS